MSAVPNLDSDTASSDTVQSAFSRCSCDKSLQISTVCNLPSEDANSCEIISEIGKKSQI